MNNAIARNKAIYNLLNKYKSDEEKINGLSYGFIDDSIKDEFEELYDKYLVETQGQVDTDYDKALFSSWFYTEPKKIIGAEKLGSGYINPVVTVGKVEELEDLIPYKLKENPAFKAERKTTAKKEVKKELPIEKTHAIINKLVSFEKKAKDKNNIDVKPIQEIPTLLSVEDSLKIYSPNIPDAEIKGYVYYKQKYGSPMYGWEKYFLPVTNDRTTLCYATKSFSLKDQQFKDVKSVPSGAVLGIKTRFKNDYDGEVFWVIKTENKELYYASELNFIEQKTFASVDQQQLINLVKEKGLCYDGNDYVPIFMYTYGDLYEIKQKLKGTYNKENDSFEGGYYNYLVETFGLEIAKWHENLIEEKLKTKYRFDFSNPIISERPYLSKENDISHTFKIKELNPDSGVSFKRHFDDIDSGKRNKVRWNENVNSVTLFEGYEIWFSSSVTENMLEKTTISDIKNLYFKNGNVFLSEESLLKSKKDQDKEKDERRILAKIEGDKFYGEFLSSALITNDLLALNEIFNRSFNNFCSYDLDRVPVGFEANSAIFNQKSFLLKPVQRRGLAFLNVNNSGCNAYDVGFGKTLVAIHNLAMNLKQGTIKRPLIAVPKQVYKNWIYEMFGYWTNGTERDGNYFQDAYFVNGALTGTKYKLNSWFNLGEGRSVENKLVDEYTITLVTYQGLEAIGFSDKLHEEMAGDFFEILNVDKEKKTERNIEKEKEQNESLVGKALAKTKYDIDVLGFDYLVFDEAHAFKNIFSSIKIPEEFRDSWRMGKGSQSSRALKAFTLSLYIQKKYGGNVNILTATPFTNSPMELYSMLSLVGYNYLVSSNINNLFKFMSMFIETTVEYTVDHLQNIVLNTVIKSFKNKNILRDILYRYFDYQDNPLDAGVKRPCKIDFPNKNVSTYLQMSDKQKEAQVLVVEEANSYDRETNRGAMGRALSWAKSNAFSPFLIPNIEKYEDLEEFVDESPKIKYTIESIKTVKDWHDSKGQNCSGQVIYSNRGKDLFPDFKKALEQQCGFVRDVKFGGDIVDEVEIITSSNSEADADRKELIKDAFNEGFVKVIIGTSTIQEGINLQKRGTCLYNLDLDWNPTGAKQLSGRIHRQGNMFKYVRIVVPLVQDTLDSFINQKLDEKSKRIASIWDKENKVNDYSVNDALDPMEIKYNLIKDENKLFSMRLGIALEKNKKDTAIAEEKYNAFETLKGKVENFNYYKNKVLPEFEETCNNYINYLSLINKFLYGTDDIVVEKNKKAINSLKSKIEEVIAMYKDFSNNGNWKSLFDFKRACEARRFTEVFKYNEDEYSNYEISYSNLKKKYEGGYRYFELNDFSEWTYSSFMEAYGSSKRLEKNLLKPYGLTIEDDFSQIGLEYKDNYDKVKFAYDYMNGEEYKAILLDEIREELEKRQLGVGDLFERVDAFAETNYLLSYPFDDSDSENCEIPIKENESSEKYMKQELKVDEYLDVDDISEKVAKQKLSKIKDFLNKDEYLVMFDNIPEFKQNISDVYKTIKDTPELYATESVENKIAYLHYFSSSSDWYVLELQKGDIFDDDTIIQKEAFVYAILNGDLENAEYGYSDLNEIKKHAELDLNFEPTELKTIIDNINSKDNKIEFKSEENEQKEIEEAIEILKLLEMGATKKEKKEILEAKEILELLLN